jgi:hypothetical protein
MQAAKLIAATAGAGHKANAGRAASINLRDDVNITLV